MKKKGFKRLVALALFFIHGFVIAEEPQNAQGIWNLHNADIKTIIEQVSRETGKNFLVDPRVKGNISIISHQAMTPEEVYQVFESILQVLGYAAVQAGNVIKIVPDSAAKSMETPVASPHNPGKGDEVVARVIPLEYTSATSLVPSLRALVSPQGHLAAYPGSNTLIVVDRASNVSRIAKLVKRMDVEESDMIEHIKLENAMASEIADSLNKILTSKKSSQAPFSQVTIAADDRSNTILLAGDKKRREQLYALIKKLDVEVKGASNTEVVFLKYQKAEDVVPILTNVITSYFSSLSATKTGAPSAAGGAPVQATDTSRAVNKGNTASSVSYSAQQANTSLGADLNYEPGVSFDSEFLNRESIGTVIGGFGVQSEPKTNSLVISAPPSLMRSIKTVIARLDIRRPQVLVEAVVVEMVDTNTFDFGVEWRTGGNFIGGFTGNGQINNLQTTLDKGATPQFGPGLEVGYVHNGSVKALVEALQSNISNNILATPSLVAMDNSQAFIFVGETVFVRTGSYTTAGTTNEQPFETFAPEKVGLSLSIIPQITQDTSIQLTVEQLVDSIRANEDINNNPVFDNRAISTSVLVNDGDILVLGGLIRLEEAKTETKVPFFGDIPILGYLFKYTSDVQIKRNLMVFLRPVIIRDEKQSLRVTRTKYDYIYDQLLVDDAAYNLSKWGMRTEDVILPIPFAGGDCFNCI